MPRVRIGGLLLAAVLGCSPGVRARDPVEDRPEAPGEARVSSNVLRRDYAGSRACRPCHGEIHEAWSRSPMHRMTRPSPGAEIDAPFAGEVFRFHGDEAQMSTRGEERHVRFGPADGAGQTWRVTKVIGGRHREDFVGVLLEGDGEERVLPVSWVPEARAWRYKGYSVMVTARPELRPGAMWRQSCIVCHNTLPGITTLYDDLLGDRRRGYLGTPSDHLLPAERRWSPVIRDRAGLEAALVEELAHVGGATAIAQAGDLEGHLVQSIEVTRASFGAPHLIEVGIGCEACHGGARAHAEDPDLRPSYAPVSPLFDWGPRGASRAAEINRGCARCHTVLFSRYPYTWEGGRRRDPIPGGSNINSGEARDYLLGAGCREEMRCTVCHDPHQRDAPEALARLERPEGNATCTACHAAYTSAEALAQHSRHNPKGAGAACVQCHLPRKNLGLDDRLTRYHRIGTPADPVRVEGDRPLECALCHGDRSVAWILGALASNWGRRYDPEALRSLYGPDLDVNILEATLRRGKPHEQAVALALAGEQARADLAPLLREALRHPIPLVRRVAARSLEDLANARGRAPP